MKKIIDYVTVYSDIAFKNINESFDKNINSYLDVGYQFLGDLQVSHTDCSVYLIQTLVKYEENGEK